MTIDRLDYHWDAARDAEQPGEQGYVHIACFLGWVFGHGLHAKRRWPAAFMARAIEGSATLQEYIDASDQKLIGAELTAEGQGFAAHSYDAYLAAYDAAFPDVPDYAIPFDPGTRRTTTAILDELYAAWVAAGRPQPEPRDDTGGLTPDELAQIGAQVEQAMDRVIVIPEGATEEEIDVLLDGLEGPYSTVTLPPGWTEQDLARINEDPHERPDLEARLPPTIAGIPPYLRSESGADPPLQRMMDLLDEAAAKAGIDLTGFGYASGSYDTGAVIEGETKGFCSVGIWSLPNRAPDTLAGIVRASLRPGDRPARWVERGDPGLRTWTAEVRTPMPASWVVFTIEDLVVDVMTDDRARLEEALAWFRDQRPVGIVP